MMITALFKIIRMEVCLYVTIMYFKNLIKIRKIRIIVIVKV